MESGELAQHNVEWEHKREVDHVSLVTNVELDVKELPLKLDRVVKQLFTEYLVHTENGAHVQPNVEQVR